MELDGCGLGWPVCCIPAESLRQDTSRPLGCWEQVEAFETESVCASVGLSASDAAIVQPSESAALGFRWCTVRTSFVSEGPRLGALSALGDLATG